MRRAGLPRVACLLALLTATPALAQAPAQAPELRRIPAQQATTVLGRRVLDRAGDQIGTLVDVIADAAGRPLAAVVDFGGYMGVGSRKIAVDWTRLRFTIGGGDTRASVDLDANTIAAAPEYKDGTEDTQVLTGPAPKQ